MLSGGERSLAITGRLKAGRQRGLRHQSLNRDLERHRNGEILYGASALVAT